jgi:hypothetical protein
MAGHRHQGYNMEDHDEGHTNFEMEEYSKEDNITDWNSPPIYDEYLDEDCELFMGRQIVEDDDQSLFSQGEAITHTNDANFIVQIQKVTHFSEIGDFIWEVLCNVN